MLYILRNFDDVKKQQNEAFKFQSIACFVIYGCGLISTWSLVNFDVEWCYNNGNILNNINFNCMIAFTIFTGLFSLILSYKPNAYKLLQSFFSHVFIYSDQSESDKEAYDETDHSYVFKQAENEHNCCGCPKGYFRKLLSGLLVIVLLLLPIGVWFICMNYASNTTYIVKMENTNEAIAIRSLVIYGEEKIEDKIGGCLLSMEKYYGRHGFEPLECNYETRCKSNK